MLVPQFYEFIFGLLNPWIFEEVSLGVFSLFVNQRIGADKLCFKVRKCGYSEIRFCVILFTITNKRYKEAEFTNLNGYTDQTRYQVYGKMSDNSNIVATSDVPEVKFEISKIVEGRATVKATYNGLTKIFLIN